MNDVTTRPQFARRRKHESSTRRPWNRLMLVGIRTGSTIEEAQPYAPPLQIVGPVRVAIDLNVHHQCARLLNLADSSQLHAITEPGGDLAGWCVSAQIAARSSWQHKENDRGPSGN